MKRREQKQFWALCTLYLLAAYILFQILWWGSHIIHLTSQLGELKNDPSQRSRVLAMVLGEGSVFALLLLTGFFYIHRTLRKEFRFAKVQSAFLLSVTHELKTPVAAIKLGLDTMRQRQLNDDQRLQLVGSMTKEAMRLQLLSENIVLAARLDMRVEELLNESINCSELLLRANKLLFPEEQKTQINIQPEVYLTGDESLLRALYSNLIENAIKYNRENGLVFVTLSAKSDQVLLEVTDQGKGIPIGERELVKTKFYRMGDEHTRKHHGTGLGLFIVDQVVKLHNARWLIDEAPDGGCTIKVYFNRQHNGTEK